MVFDVVLNFSSWGPLICIGCCSHLVAKIQFYGEKNTFSLMLSIYQWTFTLQPELLSLSVNSNGKQEDSEAKKIEIKSIQFFLERCVLC